MTECKKPARTGSNRERLSFLATRTMDLDPRRGNGGCSTGFFVKSAGN